jgi:hypothetical protein
MAISQTREKFNEAFKAARATALAGGPKTFEFEGKKYSTDLAKPKSQASSMMDVRAKRLKEEEDAPTRAYMKESERLGTFVEPYKIPNYEAEKAARVKAEKAALVDAQSTRITGSKGTSKTEDEKRAGFKEEKNTVNPFDKSTAQQQEVDRLAMRKGGMVKAKRTSNRGAGIAVKGFGRAGGR